VAGEVQIKESFWQAHGAGADLAEEPPRPSPSEGGQKRRYTERPKPSTSTGTLLEG
jgi:hypothetical protein